MHLNGRLVTDVKDGLVPMWQHGACIMSPGQQDLSVH